VSKFLARMLERRGYSGTVLVPPGDVDVSVRPPREPRRWLLVARCTPLKGGDRFIRLVAAADVDATVVGDGPELDAWRALAGKVGARVTFTGRLSRTRLDRVYAAHDVAFLLPRCDARQEGAEGFGLVLAEAAAAGLAVVGCRTGGVPEAVGAGLLLDAPDDVKASVAQLRSWLGAERGAACQTFARETWGTERAVQTLLA
jgi:glycosyltransferase involved in cell wall biosynthesis